MRLLYFWKKPQPLDNVLLCRSCLKRHIIQSLCKPPATVGVLQLGVTKALAYSQVVTIRVTIPLAMVTCPPNPRAMDEIDNCKKSLPMLHQEGLVRLCVNMGNNRYVK